MATSKKKVFSEAELEAMQDAKVERKKGKKADGEADLLAKVAEMSDSDRAIAERLHALVKQNAPELLPKTWYGMPAWANAAGKIVCFFTAADKFDTRYASFGFNEAAKLDDGTMWPTAFAITKLTPADEDTLAALIKKAVG
ncbi:iron chaperone [Devosia sp. ZW T5_3]|uniref:iron chaperone n=1 Tax=Devosia sp. ZW T5_3 TaxID=3378085 RepID=UPI003852BFD0